MTTDREILAGAMDKLGRAVERGTGTSFDSDEVQIVGRMLHAIGSMALGNVAGREVCAVCGRPSHPEQAIGGYGRHAYEPGLLVPMIPDSE
jgi:hypothetical protein